MVDVPDQIYIIMIVIVMLQISTRALLEAATIPEIPGDYPFLDPRPPLNTQDPYKIFYQTGKSEEELPICAPLTVCNKIDVYETPWVQRQCRCQDGKTCSTSLNPRDGHTITDKTRLFKVCEPVVSLPTCKYFRDVTWTFATFPNNVTEQVVHCVCPSNSVAYIVKRKAFATAGKIAYQYSFACSPQSRLRCQRKEPCRLFTVRKEKKHQEVNTSTLCQCPHNHRCPKHHLNPGVIPGKMYSQDGIRTYSGYCT